MPKTQTAQLDLFAPNHFDGAHEMINPFAGICGVNLFGQRALFVGCWTCTGGDLVRPGYAGGAA